MSASSTHEFPSPVGGLPDSLDFAPSIVFAVGYALLVPVVVWRMAHPKSRNTVLLATSFFSIERVVSFSLRAKAASDPAFGASEGLETYLQTSYSGGFISIGQDLVNLFRALLVASTLGGDMVAAHKLTPPHVRKAKSKSDTDSAIELAPRAPGPAGGDRVYEVNLGAREAGPEFMFADQTRLRQRMRRWLVAASVLFLIAMVVSATAGGNYKEAVNGSNAALVRSLWYVSTLLGLVLLAAAGIAAHVAYVKLPRVPRTSALLVVLVASLLSIVGVYRITVFSRSTTAFDSTAPGAQNAPRDKIAFYVLHAAPEFLSVAILVSLNARRVFGTGPFGDLRSRDPKPKPKPAPEPREDAGATS